MKVRCLPKFPLHESLLLSIIVEHIEPAVLKHSFFLDLIQSEALLESLLLVAVALPTPDKVAVFFDYQALKKLLLSLPQEHLVLDLISPLLNHIGT
jgi:hypothetical protein